VCSSEPEIKAIGMLQTVAKYGIYKEEKKQMM
jgi:hypothetical protein